MIIAFLKRLLAGTPETINPKDTKKMTKVLVLYYSSYGHIETMAYAVAEGVKSAGAEVVVKRVPELVPEEVAKSSHFKLDQAAPIATVDELAEYDAIIVGAGTRFGTVASQMRNFWDQTGGLWFGGKLASPLMRDAIGRQRVFEEVSNIRGFLVRHVLKHLNGSGVGNFHRRDERNGGQRFHVQANHMRGKLVGKTYHEIAELLRVLHIVDHCQYRFVTHFLAPR